MNLLVVGVLTAIAGNAVYVAPDGSDANTGRSPKVAVASIARALEVVRGSDRPVIHLAEGDYLVTEPIKFGPADSDVTVEGSGKRLSRLEAGRIVRKWRKADEVASLPAVARGHVYECDLASAAPGVTPGVYARRGFGLPAEPAALELFFDGRPMPLARWPNPDAPDGGWIRIDKISGPRTIGCASEVPFRWKNTGDVLALGYWQFDWAESYEHVIALNASRHEIELGHTGDGCREYTVGRRFRLLNAIEALDEPGEWFCDRHAGKLYFWPPKPIQNGECVVSSGVQDLVQIEGAHKVTLRHLLIEGGRAGAVRVHGGGDNLVEGCLIRNMGTYGVSISDSPNSGVRGCDLTGLGDYGISLVGGNRDTLLSGRLFAENNRIWGYSRWRRTYQPGILLAGVGARVEHNSISDAPHNGMLLSGNDHVIRFNDFARLCTETGDAGAIYMGRNPVQRGVQIMANRFTEMGPTVATKDNYTGVICVYLDDCWSGTRIAQNMFDCVAIGVMIGGGRDNVVQRNAFIGCRPAIHIDARGKGWAKDLFLGDWGFRRSYDEVLPRDAVYLAEYPQLRTYWSDDPAFPKSNVVTGNLSVGGAWLELLDGLTERDFQNAQNLVDPARAPDPYGWIGVKATEIGPRTGARPADMWREHGHE